MLTGRLHFGAAVTPRARQNGVVLFIALIVLVAMTLAGIALVRSVDTSNIIAGNLAFQQAATHSGDAGSEAAITWLEANNTGTNLHNHNFPNGYSAVRQDPAVNQSWDNYWTNVLVPGGLVLTINNGAADAAGNVVSYTITRLCNSTGDPTAPGVGCTIAAANSSGWNATSSQGSGQVGLQYSGQVYYRITSRIAGPRNTVSYIQTIVAM